MCVVIHGVNRANRAKLEITELSQTSASESERKSASKQLRIELTSPRTIRHALIGWLVIRTWAQASRRSSNEMGPTLII